MAFACHRLARGIRSPMNQPAHPIPATKIPCYRFESDEDVRATSRRSIANTIRQRNAFGHDAVLGLPTGSTPVGIYRELIRMHREEGLDFSRVVTFNLDEYYGLGAERLQSYHRWMSETFFDHVNIPPQNVHLLDGTTPPEQVEEHCRRYEEAIRHAGGIDVLLLGIGRTGTSASTSRSSARQPHPAGHARSGHTQGRGQRLLPRRQRAGPGPDDGHRHDLRGPADHAPGLRRAQGEDRPRGGRGAGGRPRAGQLPPRAPQRLAAAGRGGRRRVDRRGDALGAGSLGAKAQVQFVAPFGPSRQIGPVPFSDRRVERSAGEAGRVVALRSDGQGPAEARRRRLPPIQPARAAPRPRPLRPRWPIASSAG